MNNDECYKSLIDYLQKNYSEQNILYIREKAYSTLFFTQDYVLKLFPMNNAEYDFNAIQHEFEWDACMPIIRPKLINVVDEQNNGFTVLEMVRLPKFSNLLFMFLKDRPSSKFILQIALKLWDIITGYEKIEMCWEQLYTNYISNLKKQVCELNEEFDYIYNDIEWIFGNNKVKMVFKLNSEMEKPAIIHGNMFSGNIYYFQDQLIVLDPISCNHISKISFKEIDIASFLSDIGIFYYDIYKDIKQEILTKLGVNEKVLQLFIILKILVRLRFALYEYVYEKDSKYLFDENRIIIKNAERLFKQECERLYDLLESPPEFEL